MEATRRIEQGPGPSTARELQAVLHAARDRAPFLVYRDPAGAQRILGFGSERTALTLGRNPTADLSIGWDDQVSALHAVIERLASELTLRDDGLSRNGSYLNGERVHGIRRLRDGDMLRLGRTLILVRNPADADRSATAAALRPSQAANLSEQQRKVLSVLCRPRCLTSSQSDTCRRTRNALRSPNGLSKTGCSANATGSHTNHARTPLASGVAASAGSSHKPMAQRTF